MTNWWEWEQLAQARVQERLSEAERERMARQGKGMVVRHPGFLSHAASWLKARFLAPPQLTPQSCCADAGLGQCSGSYGSLIL